MSLKNDIERDLGTPVRLRPGAPGSLRFLVNGEEVFSKKQAGRSPTTAEILKLISEKAPQH